jgi:hypothetical protein
MSHTPYGTVSWSPSSQYLLYSAKLETTAEYLVIRPDGSGRTSLSQLLVPSGSTSGISAAAWTRVSDTVYLRKYDAVNGGIESINFVEVDSLSQVMVDANGAFGFADRVYLTE